MMDRVLLVGGKTSHQHTHNTFQQQPHDAADAARLYGEVEEKAAAKITSVIAHQLEGINAQFASVTRGRNMMDMSDHYQVIFKLNGKACTADAKVDRFGQLDEMAVFKDIAEAITEEVLKQLVPSLYQQGGMGL